MSNIVKFQEELTARRNALATTMPANSDISPERFIRIVVQSLSKNPKLTECSVSSLVRASMQAAELGVVLGGATGEAYLVPQFNKQHGGWEADFRVGYRGMIKLALRSGAVKKLSAHIVRENDKFEYELGLEPKVKHIPALHDRGNIVGAYSIALLTSGEWLIEYMSKDEIDRIRGRSKSSNAGPWVTDYEEMARKTVLRRLWKYVPVDGAEVVEQLDNKDFDLTQLAKEKLQCNPSSHSLEILGTMPNQENSQTEQNSSDST